MEVLSLGYNFSHAKGEFCRKRVCGFYSVCCFSTPFLYLKNGKLIKGEVGDILINTPDVIVYHGPTDEADEGFVNDWFQIVGEDFEELLSKYPLPLNVAFGVGKNDFFRKYAVKIAKEIKTKTYGYNNLISCYITEMIVKLYRTYNDVNLQSDYIDSIVNIHNEILLKPELNWTLEKMSKASGYSVSRFCELYKATYNISPINDVINERIEMAKRLLISGQASVLSISEACGFSTVNYFSKCFKKAAGCAPSEYRK